MRERERERKRERERERERPNLDAASAERIGCGKATGISLSPQCFFNSALIVP